MASKIAPRVARLLQGLPPEEEAAAPRLQWILPHMPPPGSQSDPLSREYDYLRYKSKEMRVRVGRGREVLCYNSVGECDVFLCEKVVTEDIDGVDVELTMPVKVLVFCSGIRVCAPPTDVSVSSHPFPSIITWEGLGEMFKFNVYAAAGGTEEIKLVLPGDGEQARLTNCVAQKVARISEWLSELQKSSTPIVALPDETEPTTEPAQNDSFTYAHTCGQVFLPFTFDQIGGSFHCPGCSQVFVLPDPSPVPPSSTPTHPPNEVPRATNQPARQDSGSKTHTETAQPGQENVPASQTVQGNVPSSQTEQRDAQGQAHTSRGAGTHSQHTVHNTQTQNKQNVHLQDEQSAHNTQAPQQDWQGAYSAQSSHASQSARYQQTQYSANSTVIQPGVRAENSSCPPEQQRTNPAPASPGLAGEHVNVAAGGGVAGGVVQRASSNPPPPTYTSLAGGSPGTSPSAQLPDDDEGSSSDDGPVWVCRKCSMANVGISPCFVCG